MPLTDSLACSRGDIRLFDELNNGVAEVRAFFN